jgi:hypothetical protein
VLPELELLTEFEGSDELGIALSVRFLEVIQETATLANHFEKATLGVMILWVALEVFVEFVDVSRQQSDLNFRRTGVSSALSEFLNDCSFLFFNYCFSSHCFSYLFFMGVNMGGHGL